MINRIFITSTLPETLIAKHRLSFAACNFSLNLISGGGFDKVYSILPLYVGGEMEDEAFEDDRFELMYDNLRIKRGIWQKMAVIKEQWTAFREIPNGSSVWFYNLNTLNALLFVLLKLFKPSVLLNVIVLDFTPVTKGLGLNQLYIRLINHAHGRICLADSPLFNKENCVIIPGVVPNNQDERPLINRPNNKFLLSGALNEVIAQTSKVLEAFSRLPECELHITGNQNCELITKYASQYPNIVYHEQLPFDDYLELLHSVTYQLSTRDASYPENQCNFPSKIVEALLHNRAIVSTIHYAQLDGIRYYEIGSSIDTIIEDIQNIVHIPESEVLRYANQGADVTRLFSTGVWNQTMDHIESAQ